MYSQINFGSRKYQFNFHQDYSIRFYHGEPFIPEEGLQILHCIGTEDGGIIFRTTEIGPVVPDLSRIREMGMICATASASVQSDPS